MVGLRKTTHRGEIIMKSQPQLAKIVQFKKPPRTKKNKDLRTREYLSEDEIFKLIAAIRKRSRNPDRDECLIWMMFQHGLRVSEVVGLRWDQVNFKTGMLHVNRLKGSVNSVHPITGVVMRLLRKLERQDNKQRHIFISERKAVMDSQAVYRIIRRSEKVAGFEFPIHPHMLRHSCGYYLANKGTDTRTIQQYMGHAHISNTVRYTHLDAGKFNGLF